MTPMVAWDAMSPYEGMISEMACFIFWNIYLKPPHIAHDGRRGIFHEHNVK